MNNKELSMDERAQREKERYNSDTIRRDGYTNLFSRSTFDAQMIDNAITDRMKVADGSDVLEIGSNAFIGWIVTRGLKPAKLTCINISDSELKLGTDYIEKNRVAFPVEFKIMDANRLEFDDYRFDLVFGGAILHHLNFNAAIKEIHRVLKPGGCMVFHEPLGSNPIAQLIRFFTPYARTNDEKPLRMKDLEYVNKFFIADFVFFQFFTVFSTMFFNVIGVKDTNPINSLLFRIDTLISRHLPFFNPYFREILLSGKKKET